MQILAAYSLRRPRGRIDPGVERVGRYYGHWAGLDRERGVTGEGIGLRLWDSSASAASGAAWQHDDATGDAAATLYAPAGRRLDAREPLGSMRALAADPARVVDLTPPWGGVLFTAAEAQVHVFTDALGVGRLFQLDTAKGTFLSNRPALLPLLAGVRPRASRTGWHYTMATDWAMGDTSGYRDVRAVPAGAHLVLRAGELPREECLSLPDRLPGLFAPRSVLRDPNALDEVVVALQDSARSIARQWPGQRPTVNLSGGRDSRVVAAAFLSAGVDVRLHTHDAFPGEAEVARTLVALHPAPVQHEVERATSARASPVEPAVLDRAQDWHRFGESLRPSSFLWHQPPGSLTEVRGLVIGGGGGEIAHGFYYPDESTLARWSGAGTDEILAGAVAHLDRRLCLKRGLRPRTRAMLVQHFREVMGTAVAAGVTDVRMLDYFYVDERLRRWGLIGERLRIVAPLLVPDYVQAALSLRPDERLANRLHLALLERMVPAWSRVPFFRPEARSARTPRRVGRAADRDELDRLLAAQGPWSRDLRPDRLAEVWARSCRGETTASQETILRRVVWRAGFDRHLAELQSASARPAAPLDPEPVTSTTSPLSRLTRPMRRG